MSDTLLLQQARATSSRQQGAGFRAWFVLQHLKGYKPFINKISFERSFRENFSIGKDYREEKREKKKKEEEILKQIGRKKIGEL